MKVCLGCNYYLAEFPEVKGPCKKHKTIVFDIQEACGDFKDRKIRRVGDPPEHEEETDLSFQPLHSIYRTGIVVYGSFDKLSGSSVVAFVLKDSVGLTVLRVRPWVPVDKILGTWGLDEVLMRRELYDVKLTPEAKESLPL